MYRAMVSLIALAPLVALSADLTKKEEKLKITIPKAEDKVDFRPHGKIAGDLKNFEGEVRAVAYSHDGKLLASLGSDSVIRLWDDSGKAVDAFDAKIARRALPELRGLKLLQFSPKENLLVIAGGRNEGLGVVAFWHIGDKRLTIPPHRPHKRQVSGIAFSKDGKDVYTTDIGCHVVAKWKSTAVLEGAIAWKVPVCWTVTMSGLRVLKDEKDEKKVKAREGEMLCFGGDKLIAFHSPGTPGIDFWPTERKRIVLSVAVDQKNRTIAYADCSGFTIWSLEDLNKYLSFQTESHCTKVSFSPNGTYLAIRKEDGVAVIGLRGGAKFFEQKSIESVRVFHGEITDMAFSPVGRRIALATNTGIRIEGLKPEKIEEKGKK